MFSTSRHHLQHALQIGAAARVTAVLDIVKQMAPNAVSIFSSIQPEKVSQYSGDVGFNAARFLSRGALKVSQFAMLRRSYPGRLAISL
jgi:hypothetical protein